MFHSKKRLREESSEQDKNIYEIYWGYNNSFETPLEKYFVYTIGNEIHFTTDINTVSIQEIIKQITILIQNHLHKNNIVDGNNTNYNNVDKLKIIYIVDSPGGSVISILKFVDFINIVKKKYPFVQFTSIITGLTASAGTIMAIVADKRYMTKNAHAMIHELSSGNDGNYTKIMSHVKFLDELHTKLVEIYISKSFQTKKDIEKLLQNETWFNANKYLQYGFIDKIK